MCIIIDFPIHVRGNRPFSFADLRSSMPLCLVVSLCTIIVVYVVAYIVRCGRIHNLVWLHMYSARFFASATARVNCFGGMVAPLEFLAVAVAGMHIPV